jgi:methyltransferase (TIGR00027 family)
MTSDSPISSISDTARWVAVYRAWESSRPDALFHDPYAQRLAGERGRAIALLMPRQARSGWPIVVRTKLIDDVITAAVQQHCDTVVNLAAGLDTRPYRMELPSSLRWCEVDLPALSEEKERLLADSEPRCRLMRIRADLRDASERRRALREAVGSGTRVLVLTEGLLVYLDQSAVQALSKDLLAEAGIRWWVLDLASPAIVQMMRRSMGKLLANAPMQFAPPTGVAYFEALGWRVLQMQELARTAARVKRLPWFIRPFMLLPQPNPRDLRQGRWAAVLQLEPARH